MNIKKSFINNLFQVLKDEFTKSDGHNKYLILALTANVPFFFIPFVTQIVTIILLAFYLRNYSKNEKPQLSKASTGKVILGIPILTFCLVVLTIIIQLPLIWLPYTTQILSLIILSLPYVLSRKNDASPKSKN